MEYNTSMIPLMSLREFPSDQIFGGKMTTEIIGMFYPILIIVGVIVIIVVVLWQGMNVAKTQISAEQTENYRKLAEQAATAEQKSADAQQKTAEALDDIRARLAAIEKLLSEVQ
jgi:phosphotransferase system  glucose/maltose/N-acetylglucosamine-specific IIC component